MASAWLVVARTGDTVEASFGGYPGLIAFQKGFDDADEPDDIYVMNADGSEETRLTIATGSGVGSRMPAWSPDGTKIAFVSDRTGNMDVYVMNADGSNQVRLTNTESIEGQPTWSPDGSRIAYTALSRVGPTTRRALWVIEANGKNPVNLTPSEEGFDPTWSPDGKRIAFVSDRGDIDDEIWVMNADGTAAKQLTHNDVGDQSPDWSPDGTEIVFARFQEGLFVVGADGTNLRRVRESPTLVSTPDWSPDGRYLVFGQGYDGEILRLDLEAGTPPTIIGEASVGRRYPDWQSVHTPPATYGDFTPLTPARVLDTRIGLGRGGVGPLGANSTFDVQITGRGGVAKTGVTAVVMNVTVTQPTARSYLTVWPTGFDRPDTSSLNFVPGQTVPNLVTVAVGPSGAVSVANAFGAVHVIFDVAGFYSDDDGPIGSRFHSLAPTRLFDTRSNLGGVGTSPVGPTRSLKFNVLGRGGLPRGGLRAVVMNVTVTQPTARSYLTVFPGDVGVPPTVSNLNYVAGLTVPNLVVVRVPPNGVIEFHNAFGTAHVIADVVGFYDDDRTTEAGRLIPLVPERYYDSRMTPDGPWGPQETSTLGDYPGFGNLPLGEFQAVLLNVTAVTPTEQSFLTVFPSDLCTVPNASNLNFTPGRNVPNMVIVRLAANSGCAEPQELETITIHNHRGFVHVVVDVFGAFTTSTTSLFDDP